MDKGKRINQKSTKNDMDKIKKCKIKKIINNQLSKCKFKKQKTIKINKKVRDKQNVN